MTGWKKLTMISIKKNLKRGLPTLLMLLTVLTLSACGGSKKISTKDNSVDYKSAKSLPPLKKPSRVVVAPRPAPTISSTPAPQQSAEQIEEPLVQTETPTPQIQEPVAQAEEPIVQTQESVAEVEEPVVQAQEPEVQTQAEEADAVETNQPLALNASVVTEGSGQARLVVDASFEQAWEYLSQNMKKSDLTIFSRNKEAGRFSIGCANIAAAPTVVKSGRWSFFNRGKQLNLEHCSLKLAEKRGKTSVSVLNRAGEEVSGEYSNTVFSRILNN